jgi:eukaryotic-like serine/threonine-protein kinase
VAEQMVSHFRVLGKLGEGGMGVVYRAEDVRLGRPVALKFLPQSLAGDPRALARFKREARAASALNHPNICTIYDVGEDAGQHFIAMELLEGRTLHDLIGGRPRDGDEVVRVGLQVAEALEAAHARGIIHRDIKPANIFVGERGQVKVLDFGLASLEPAHRGAGGAAGPSLAATVSGPDLGVTGSGAVVGTLAYMSPEQARGVPLDARSDLFSLGAVLYEMSSGRRAFDGPTAALVVDAVLHRSPAPLERSNPNVPPGLVAVVAKALEKDRDMRYQSAADLRADLMRLRRDSESGTTAITETRRSARKRTAGIVIVAALAVAAVASGLYLSRRRADTPGGSSSVWEAVTNFADSAVSPAISRDGRMVAFVRGPETFFGPGQVYVKLLPDGEPVRLTRDEAAKMDPEFSPDGSRIAYTAYQGGWDTWVVPTLGGEPRLMLANAESVRWIGTSELLFSEIKTGLHMALVTASESRAQSRDVYVPPRERGMAHRASLSPDRKWVLVAEMDNGGWLPCRLVPFDGSSRGRIVGPSAAGCTSAAWSPDGNWMYFSADVGNRFHVWRQRFPEGAPEQVTFGATEEEGLAVAPDGRSLVTSVGITASTVVVRDDTGEHEITSEGYAERPMFSRDGQRLFYLVMKGGAAGHQFVSGELMAADRGTGRSEPLLPGFSVTGYAVARDDRRIVFSAVDPQGRPHLWLAEIGLRAPPRELASSAPEDQPAFAADGSVYFRAAEGGSNYLYRTNPAGTGREKVLPDPILEFRAVSPDGRWVVVSAVVSRERDAAPETVALPVGGGPAVTIRRGYCDVSWSPDGALFAVYGDNMGGGRTIVAPVPPGETFPLVPAAGSEMATSMSGAKGVRTLDGPWIPGPRAGLYVSLRRSVHRNLYRIPLR